MFKTEVLRDSFEAGYVFSGTFVARFCEAL